MSKIIKINQKDIEKMVYNILEQNNFDDFGTKKQPEEFQNDDEIVIDLDDNDDEDTHQEETNEQSSEGGKPEYSVGKDQNGKFYVMNINTGEVLGTK